MFQVFYQLNEETILLAYKNTSLFFIVTKGSKWPQVSETEKRGNRSSIIDTVLRTPIHIYTTLW